MQAAVGDRFAPLFARAASRVRARMAWRYVLTGAALGLAGAALVAAVAWKLRAGNVRVCSVLVGIAGAALGFVVARRRRWSDVDVALYLDAALGGEESIATAISLGQSATRDVVESHAAEVLAKDAPKRARPRVLSWIQGIAPFAAAALAWFVLAPLPPKPARVDPPGAARVTVIDAKGLEAISSTLAAVTARDDAQRARLAEIARDAAKLKEDLRAGMETRDAQDRIARIHDAIDRERLSLGDGERRAGLESAVGKLEQTPSTQRAARALGDHDLQSMDSEMERIANAREANDRALAEHALDDAADGAKKNGASDVAKVLEDEKRLLQDRANRAGELRDLAEAMRDAGVGDESVGRQLESLDRKSSDQDARALAQAMANALKKLTPDERKKLASKLADEAKAGQASSDPERLHDLAKALRSPDGAEKLEDQLRSMADDPTTSAEAQREHALDDAQRGAGEAEEEVDGQKPGANGGSAAHPGGPAGSSPSGSQPGAPAGESGGIPIPSGKDGNGAGGNAGSDGAGTGGSHDTGTGAHVGETPQVAGDTLKSRAHGALGHAEAMPGGITSFVPGRAGGTANARGTGDLSTVAPSEIDGIDKSDVPEEYREHVRQYFSPAP